jgi:hypothetical protein
VDFVVDGLDVRIVKAASAGRQSRGAKTVQRLRQSGGRVRASTDEIMALTRGE